MVPNNSVLLQLAAQIRYRIVELSHRNHITHLASSLSCVDILCALYFETLNLSLENINDPQRNRFILSKGHAVLALYAVLEKRGILSADLLNEIGTNNALLGEHPSMNGIAGVEWATGSLGHGLSAGLGMALAAKIQKQSYTVTVLLSDGECNEGSVWEAALFAPKHGLKNLTAIVDYNKWQATGRSQEVMSLEPLAEKWHAFGWNVCEVDGHDFSALTDALNQESPLPKAIIAHTVKGKGVSFMEDDNNWHYRVPKKDELEKARLELLGK